MKSFNFKEKFSKGKNVYTMAAVSLCLAAVAIGVVYSQTVDRLESVLPDVSTTKQVHQNQTGVSDPRDEEPTTVTGKNEITTKKPTTEKATTAEATSEEDDTAEPEYTEEGSTAVSVVAAQTFIRPHDGEIIRAYSPDVPLYSETMNDWRTHPGIDIAVNEGDEAVSIGKGTVSKVLVDSSYGYTVEVDYGSFTARYCGLKQGDSVGIGQSLEKGDSIGVIDTVPCEANAGPHLHFEIIKDGTDIDPLKTLG